MGKLMNTDNLQDWLIRNKHLGEKPSGDVLSRCRRVERILHISLENEVHPHDRLEKVLERIRKETGSYLKPGSNQQYVVSQLRRAAILYAEYKVSKKN